MNFSEIYHCFKQWLDMIAKLDDFSLIEEIIKNKYLVEKTIIKQFNYRNDYVSVDVELPAEQWGHTWHIVVSSSR